MVTIVLYLLFVSMPLLRKAVVVNPWPLAVLSLGSRTRVHVPHGVEASTRPALMARRSSLVMRGHKVAGRTAQSNGMATSISRARVRGVSATFSVSTRRP